MASESEILREYLVSLGFKIDEPGQKKFDVGLGKLNLTAMGLGKTLMGAATAAQTMVGIFAVQMEKLYYSAKKADSTVGSMQAMQFAAGQVGISGDLMRTSLEGMGRAMRANPGLAGLLNSLGVEVKGRDKAKVMMDLVNQLNKLPFSVAVQYAEMFGMSEDQYFLMKEGYAEMKAAIELRENAAKQMGIDSEAAGKAGKEYANQWREIAMYAGLFHAALNLAMIGPMHELAGATKEVLKDWIHIIQDLQKYGANDLWKRFKEGLGLTVEPLLHPKADPAPKPNEAKKKKSFWDWATSGPFSGTPNVPGSSQTGVPAVVGPTTQAPAKNASGAFSPEVQAKQAHLAALEVKYALPAGVLDALWSVESGRGKNKLSKAGAKGDMQFMDPTAKAYGVDVNSFDSSADGAARYLKDLLKRYDGDLLLALTGYSAGQTVLDKALGGRAHLKQENAEYGPKVMSRMPNGGIQQTNNITITGAGSPEDTAKMVGQAMDQANADLVRNNKLRVK